MKIEFTHRFKEQYYQLKEHSNITELLSAFVEVASKAKGVSAIQNMKRLYGFRDYYRVILGKSKIGLKIVDNTLIFAAFEQKYKISQKFLPRP